MMKNRRYKSAAIELSMNFLVIIIISIVMLGFGITFAAKLFAGATAKKAELDKATQQKIEELLTSSGSQVIIPITKKDISIGANDIFGLGIKNIYPEEKTFTIAVNQGAAIDRAGAAISGTWETGWTKAYQNSILINSNERKIVPILIGVPNNAKAGTYSFTVYVDLPPQPGGFPNAPYGSIKIFIEVS